MRTRKLALIPVLVAVCIAAAMYAAALILAPYSWQGMTTERETMMADEETVAANEAILLAHFEEIGLDDSLLSREYFARSGAYRLGREATASRIVEVSTETHENGSITVAVIDETGKTFHLSFGKYGDLSMIRGENGEIVYAVFG
jgi:lipopolysaccharide export LptBFGC system permease protein LptF